MAEHMDENTRAQRRNVHAISIGLTVYYAGGAYGNKLLTLFGVIDLDRPWVLLFLGWMLWVYFIWRFWMFSAQSRVNFSQQYAHANTNAGSQTGGRSSAAKRIESRIKGPTETANVLSKLNAWTRLSSSPIGFEMQWTEGEQSPWKNRDVKILYRERLKFSEGFAVWRIAVRKSCFVQPHFSDAYLPVLIWTLPVMAAVWVLVAMVVTFAFE